ncbi:MAG: response regulator [Limisphaerales bacterium]
MASRTILFVEDDSFVLTMYRSRLEAAGFQVEAAADGLAAIDALPRIRPDLVVLDLMLPKLHGLEVLKFIRSDVNLKATPVVILSNAYMEGLAAKAMEAGAQAGILKTQCTPAKLLKIIRDQIGRGTSKKGHPADACESVSPGANAAEALSEKASCESARAELLRSAPQEIAKIRQESLEFVKMGGSPASADQLNRLYRRVRFLSARAGLSGCTKITELISALEALLFEIGFNLSRATPSVLQSIAHAVDCLANLVQKGDIAGGESSVKRKVLVVDDDEVCSYAIVAALKRSNFDAESVQDPKAALAMLQESPFDLVLLDINMPGMDGFAVCERLRRIPHHKTTPVIFVTLHGEFQNRARSVLAGGNDLITKPISPIELTLKVTIHLLKAGGRGAAAPQKGDVAKAGVEDRQHVSAAHANGEPTADESEGGILRPAGSAKAGGNGNGRETLPAGSPSTREQHSALNRESCEPGGPRNDTISVGDIEGARSNGSTEQENSVERLRCENEDLKTSTKDLFAELARVNERLEKALTENETALRRLDNLTEEHNTAQAELGQRRTAEEELRRAGRELEQKLQGQAAELDRLAAVSKAEQTAFLGLEKAKAEQALAQTRLQQELEAHTRLAEQWQKEQKALEERLQAETRERERLSAELAAARELGARLQAQDQTLSEGRSQLEAKVEELQTAQATVAELQDKCAAVEAQFKGVKESLAQNQAQLSQETERRAAAERQASELAGLRASLEQELARRTKTEEQLRRELEEQKARVQTQDQMLSEGRSQLEAKVEELQTAQATVAELQDKCAAVEAQFKGVKESLAQNQAQLSQETECRATAERQASELAGLRGSLEQELAQRTEAEEQLRRELEEQKARVQTQDQTLSEGRSQLEAKVEELQRAQATVAEVQDKCAAVEAQFNGVKESLAQNQAQLGREAERRAAAERQASELAGLRASLEEELAQRTKAEEQLRRELEEQKARVQSQDQALSEDRSQLAAKLQELQAAKVTVAELQDKWTAAEDQASELAELRASLEQELARRTEAEERLRRELEEQKAWVQSQDQALSEHRSQLAAKLQELQTAQATVAELQDKCTAVEAQFNGVKESLAQNQAQLSREAERRAAAEGQASELAGLRASLEQELAQRTQAEEQLRRELEEQKARVQTQDQTLSEGRSQLEAKVAELQTAQATVAELQDKCAAAEGRLKGVEGSLAQNQAQLSQETECRAAAERQAGELAGLRASLEQELARRTKAEEQLRRELEEQKARVQTHDQTLSEGRSQLEAKLEELQTVQATVAELQNKCAAAESRAGELAGLRASLEQELARRTRTEEQLRSELEEQKARLQTQDQALSEGRGQLEAKVQELEATKATVAELQDKCVAAEGQASELAGLRSLLEQELAQRVKAEEQLRRELEEQKAGVQTEGQTLSEGPSQLEAKVQELQTAQATVAELQGKCAGVEAQFRGVKESLAQNQAQLGREAERRAAAEGQTSELAGLLATLEQEFTRQTKAEEHLRRELKEQKARVQVQDQTLSEDRSQLQAKVQELQAAKALATELHAKCAAAESQATELAEARTSLEDKLARNAGVEKHLRRELEEQQARLQSQVQMLSAERNQLEAKAMELQGLTTQLAAVKDQMTQQALEKEKLANRVLEGDRARVDLVQQLAGVHERETALQESIQSLESKLQQSALEHERLESSLQIELAERRRLEGHSETLLRTLDDVSTQLKETTAAEQTRAQREAELEDCIHELQRQAAESSAASAVQEVELRGAKGKLEELLPIQSALCARVQELTAAESTLAKGRQDLEQQLRMSQGRIQDGRINLAALRYAILDASRANSQLSRGQVQTIRQNAAGMTQVTAALLNSPLSLAQRRLVNSLQGALQSWMQTQLDTVTINASQIEAPVFQAVEFNLAEVTNEALRTLQQQAAGSGVEVRTEVSGDVPKRVFGNAAHIGQLLTTLPESLLRLVETKRLELRVSIEPKLAPQAELAVEFLVSANSVAGELCERLTTITTASETLRSPQAGEGETGLAVCWQLAHALGGTARVEPVSDKEVRLLVVLPVEIALPLVPSAVIPACRDEAGEALDEVRPRCLLAATTANPSFESELEADL